jgi:cytoskeletal protein CcmA (bactofilin family)
MKNLNVLKEMTVSSGLYGEVRIFAQTTFDGDLMADSLDVYDGAVFNGPVKAKKLRVSGHAIFHSTVMAMEIFVSGTADFNDAVKTNRLEVKNQVNAKTVKVESYETVIDGMGYFYELDGFRLTVNGFLHCAKQLRCNNIQFGKTGRGRMQEVLSANVTIDAVKAKDTGYSVFIDELIAYDVKLHASFVRLVKARIVEQDDFSTVQILDLIKTE